MVTAVIADQSRRIMPSRSGAARAIRSAGARIIRKSTVRMISSFCKVASLNVECVIL